VFDNGLNVITNILRIQLNRSLAIKRETMPWRKQVQE